MSEISKDIVKTVTEEYLDIDESLVELEKDKDIIRMEMNIVELPLFSKDTKRKKNQQKTYLFKHDRSSYVEIEPPDGYSIPGEFEERVFIALTKIMRNHNYSKRFFVTANEILESLGVKNKIYYTKLKSAMYTLAQTNYRFKNSLYSSSAKGIINDLILTHIMDVRVITRENEEYKNLDKFDDRRIKEIYQITFTDDFYNNIITTGYLTFDSEILLKIENSIARSIYTLTEKWRNYELYVRRPVFFLARRIPLKWDKRQLKRTIEIVEKALNELKKLYLIKDFNIIKGAKWDLAELEVFYDESHNRAKRETFHAERIEFKNIEMLITSTEERLIDAELNLDKIMEILPDRIKYMKTMEKFLNDSIKQYGYEYVLRTCEYVVLKNPSSFKAYLSKALKENYADEYIANKKAKNEKKNSKENGNYTEIEEVEVAEIIIKHSFEDFEKLDIKIQDEIEKIVYQEFLDEAEAKDDRTMRIIFEKSKKPLIVEYINDNELDFESFEFKKPLNEKVDIEIKEEKVEESFRVKENENEIIGEYISPTKFILEVSKIAKNKGIEFLLEDVAPIFKTFGEFEDEYLKIEYDNESKIGKIQIKGGL